MLQLGCMNCGKQVSLSRAEINNMVDGSLVVCSGECLRRFLTPTPYRRIHFDYWSNGAFKSKLEMDFARWLIRNKIPFLYEPFTILLSNDLYIPDFYIPLVGFIELKGLPERLIKVKKARRDGIRIFVLHERHLRRHIGGSK